jgi:adenylyltransferase/sulfurtransferase
VLHGAVAAVAGAASVEAVKVLTGHRSAEGMLYLDLWSGAVQRFEVSSLPDCPSCALRELPALRDPEATEAVAAQLCGRDAVHVRPAPTVVDLDAVADRLPAAATVTVRSPHLLRFDADGREITLFPDGRAIVKGTSDPAAARSLYARWIGV